MIEAIKATIVELGKWVNQFEKELVNADAESVRLTLLMRDRYVLMLAQSETNLKKLEAV